MKNNFNLNRYLSRYLAGEQSLRARRDISSKRFLTARSGVSDYDFESTELIEQSNKYFEAYNYITSFERLTKDILAEVNIQVSSNKGRGKGYRKTKGWIGVSLKKAKYVAPEPEEIDTLMDDLLNIVNSNDMEPMKKAHYAHTKLVLIHPFYDGNGRTARLVFDYLANKDNLETLNPYLYRLCVNEKEYFDFTTNFLTPKFKGFSNKEYADINTWTQDMYAKFRDIIKEAEKLMSQKLFLRNISEGACRLIGELWNNPIIHFDSFLKLNNWSNAQLKNGLDELTDIQVLEKRYFRENNGGEGDKLIFVCSPVLALFSQLENEMLKDFKNEA